MLFSCLLSLISGCDRVDPKSINRYSYDQSKPPMMMMAGMKRIPSQVKSNVQFKDVAEKAGLNYEWKVGGGRPMNILQTIGNGCAFFDYDHDGALDILLVGDRLALYKGDGKGGFRDVSAETGLSAFSGHYLGCAVGDIDGDGYDDLFISGYYAALLLKNERGTGFRNITEASGIRQPRWATSCAFGETEPGSGVLDLYVACYVDFTSETKPQVCTEHDITTSCGPASYKPVPGIFYKNDGKGRFTDKTIEYGFDKASGRGLGVAFAPLNGDATKPPALALANDEMPGDLFEWKQKNGGGVYENVAKASGAAFDRDGHVHAGMGLDIADFDNNSRLDMFVTTFANEFRSLYRNEGGGVFSDMGGKCGFGLETMKQVAFGCKFFDADNDGSLDLIVANGHVQDNVKQVHPELNYAMPTQLFMNSGGVNPVFSETSNANSALAKPIVGRGLATGDYDNDGRVDALVVDSNGKPMLLHNESVSTGNWFGVRLIGTKTNRDGYGAILILKSGSTRQVRHVHADGSYLSSSDPRAHFGLGKNSLITSLEIHWLSGKVQIEKNLLANRYLTITEK